MSDLGFRSEVTESALGHSIGNKVEQAYNKSKYLPERTKAMQTWADHIDILKVGGDVLPFKQKRES